MFELQISCGMNYFAHEEPDNIIAVLHSVIRFNNMWKGKQIGMSQQHGDVMKGSLKNQFSSIVL